MQVKQEKTQEETVLELQAQVEALTTANLALRDQLAQKEQFAAMIAHELKGPLAPIVSYTQMINRLTGPAKNAAEKTLSSRQQKTLQRYTDIVISQARRLSRLVNDLRDISHISTGQFRLFTESCNLVALVSETVEQLRPVAPYHTLTVQLPRRAVEGSWDPGRLQQALGNLLDNAIKYSDENTTITVRVWTTKEIVNVSVHNQGASIPSNDISQLFQPYTRLSAAREQQGTGLGLYITKSIIEAHGGSLYLEPHNDTTKGDERGTTFTFSLPLLRKK